jgi:hypothetical protein
VATIAASYLATRTAAKAPISTHPAFPAIVALWFAALLGFGSLVLPVALLERLVTVTGIGSLVPSAAPPLGFTARIAIALSGSVAGALLGLLLARQVARAHAPEPKGRSFISGETRPRRPFSAHEELGEEGLEPASGPLMTKKRRALAMAEDNRRSTYLPAIPLPGQAENQPLDFGAPCDAAADAPGEEPLDLGDFADTDFGDTPMAEPDPALATLRESIHTSADSPFPQDPLMTDRPIDEPSDLADEAFVPAVEAAPAAREAVEPLPFSAPSLRRAEAVVFDEEEIDEDGIIEDGIDENGDAEEQAAFAPPAVHLSVIEPTDEPEAIADDRPLEELGLVQLAARLGASLEKRKAFIAAQPPQALRAVRIPAPLADAEDFEAAEADEAARAIADFFGPATATPPVEEAAAEQEPAAPAVPASMRALAFDSEDADDEAALEASFSLPLGKAAAPVASANGEEDQADDDDDGDYSSLLTIKNPFVRQQEFVRVEEPEDDGDMAEPTVTFPSAPVAPFASPAFDGHDVAAPRPFDPPMKPRNSAGPVPSEAAPRDPGDAERSLRDALATLQRMSGAA